MPEGPEVLLLRDYLFYKIKNTILKDIEYISGKYKKKDIEYADELIDCKFKDILTKGKFMYFILEAPDKTLKYMMITFGLTGEWSFKKGNNSRVKFVIKRRDKSYNLYFNDDMNYGTLKATTLFSEVNKKLNNLEDDLITSEYDYYTLKQRISNYIKKYPKNDNLKIIEFLMNQDKGKSIGSGLGNYLSVEILYDSGISPHKLIKDLIDKDDVIKKLTVSIMKILKLACYRNNLGYMKDFSDYISKRKQMILEGKYPEYLKNVKIDDNKKFIFSVYKQINSPNNNPIIIDSIIKDRKTYWCKQEQS